MKKIIFKSLIALSLSVFISYAAEIDTSDGAEAANTVKDNITSSSELKPVPLNKDQRTKLLTPLENLLKTINFKLFIKEFEVSFTETKTCGSGLADKAIGMKAHMIEPVGYIETTSRAYHFPFANLDININGDNKIEKILKSGSSIRTRDDEPGKREELIYSHFIWAPIFGMMMKEQTSMLCFSDGDVNIPFMGEIFPYYKKGVMFKNLVPQMAIMMSPQGIISMVLDCTATISSSIMRKMTAYDARSSFDIKNFNEQDLVGSQDNNSYKSKISDLGEKGLDKLSFVRNSMFWSAGCLGPRPIGGYIDAVNPLTDNDLMAFGILNILHGASAIMEMPFLQKQTNFGMSLGKGNNMIKGGIPNTMCQPKDFPILPPTQYVLQRVYPTVGKPHELGEPGATHTVAGNVPGSNGDVVSMLWMRRDYIAGAYYCPSAGGKK